MFTLRPVSCPPNILLGVLFPTAAVTNYNKLDDLKQHSIKIKCVSSWGSRGASDFLCFSATWGCLQALAHGPLPSSPPAMAGVIVLITLTWTFLPSFVTLKDSCEYFGPPACPESSFYFKIHLIENIFSSGNLIHVFLIIEHINRLQGLSAKHIWEVIILPDTRMFDHI